MRSTELAIKNWTEAGGVYKTAYRVFAYFGLASVFGSLLFGFRFDPEAEGINYLLNAALYAVFALPHLIMTRSWWKKAVWGRSQGSLAERQVYISISVVSWLLVLVFQRPLPGYSLAAPPWLVFIGMVAFLLCVMAFFQGITFPVIDGLLGVPGNAMNFSHGKETPLFTDGPYASVRHPMYRAALMGGLASILIHPNLAQVFWALLIGGTFIAFIPIEERQLLAARGDEYLTYRKQTPYRLFRGIW